MVEPADIDRAAAELTAAREAILDAALDHVAFDGWLAAPLARGAVDTGHDRLTLARAFPDGVDGALDRFSARADEHMEQSLATIDLDALSVRGRVAAAVRLRLEYLAPHREAVRRALSHGALPGRTPRAARRLYRTVDAIWWAIGDTSTDYNFYTKRALLAGAYGATLLCWLDDTSADQTDTWAFFERRLADVMRLPRLVAPLRTLARRVPGPGRLARVLRARRGTAAAG